MFEIEYELFTFFIFVHPFPNENDSEEGYFAHIKKNGTECESKF